VAVSTTSARLAGTGNDAAGLLAAASASDVKTVIVAGEVLVEDARHRDVDVPRRLQLAVEAAWA
jgi:cytosine/adenosine deaminase-related metal-dependent hydrolase